jgi:hypothetical protein
MIQYHDMISHSPLSSLIMVPHQLFACIYVVHDTTYDTPVVSNLRRWNVLSIRLVLYLIQVLYGY